MTPACGGGISRQNVHGQSPIWRARTSSAAGGRPDGPSRPSRTPGPARGSLLVPDPESSPPFECAPQHRSRSRYRHCRTRSTTGCAQSKPRRGLPREFAAAAAKVAIWFLRAAALFPAPPSAVGVSVDRDAVTATAPEASWRSSRKPPEAPRWRATSTGESGRPRRWWNGNRVSGGGEGVKTLHILSLPRPRARLLRLRGRRRRS